MYLNQSLNDMITNTDGCYITADISASETPSFSFVNGSTTITTTDLRKIMVCADIDCRPSDITVVQNINNNNNNNQGDNNMINNMFNGMFGKVANGLCRYSLDGQIAIKTSSGYKTYDVANNKLINCDSFAFDFGDDFFFIIPTNKVAIGDIILVNGKPNAVVEKNKKYIKVFNYETSAMQDIVPESHVFMGNSYFYGKVVSLFGGKFGDKNMMKYMLMSQFFNKNSGSNNSFNNMNPMMMMFMMNGDMSNMFSDMFDSICDDEAEDEQPDNDNT